MPNAGTYVLVLMAATLSCEADAQVPNRLAGSNIASEGRLEVLYENVWGTVCKDLFDNVEAKIACGSLGYSVGGQFINTQYGPGEDPIWLDEVQCNGRETNLAYCSHSPWGVHDCEHDADVSIRCSEGAPVAYAMVNSQTPGEGRLEVLYDGKWGTVCDHSFSDVDADVTCFSLGFPGTGVSLGQSYGYGDGQIWLDEVQCSGTERYIAECAHSPWGTHNCAHSDDISIRCSPTSGQVQWTLAGSSIPIEGRLHVWYNNLWGTVCDHGFTDVEARVACFSLGYTGGGEFIDNMYGAGGGSIWLDDVRCIGHEQNLGQCSHTPWGTHNCGHSDDVSIRCWAAAHILYRLAGSTVEGEGRLEIQYSGQWGTVCDDGFTNLAASTACRSLGYSNGGQLISNIYGPGGGQIWLDDVQCNGGERTIVDCPHGTWGLHDCSHSEDVAIRCGLVGPILYRLAGSSITGEGRLEVQYNNTWGTVCEDSFSNVEASVACVSLGFWSGGEFINSLYGPGVGPIWLDDVKCNGTEQSIADCPHSPWGSTDCTHDQDVSIRCWKNIYYRLAGSSITGEGRLEVQYNNTWGTVCNDGFTNVEASVACVSLGFMNGGESINSLYGPGVGPIWLDDVECSGTEQSIGDCSHSPWGTTDCGHTEDVSIRCWTAISYRLAGSNITGEGRLEVQYNDTWGTVCDDSFSNVEASIACGSLGFWSGGEFINSLYGPGVGPIWLDDVKCNGTEQSIADCPHSPWGTHDCAHDQDVSIRCWSVISYRLAGSNISTEGRLEVQYNKTWGTVCDDGFSNVEANIACGSLGFSNGGQFFNSLYGPGVGPIWLDEVQCNGTEQSIADCSHEPWGSTDCGHDEDVSIRCWTGISYRLAGSNVTREGRLEVQYNETWGTVCDDSFTNVEASVACGSLGFMSGGEFIGSPYGPGVGPIWLDDVKCSGTEQSIADCTHSPWGTTDCTHDEDVSIRCSTGISYRLAGSNTTGEGRLEVQYNNTWGTVCDDGFTNVEASVACASLGYSSAGEFINSQYGPGVGPIWLDDVKCSGTEQSLDDCSHAPWGTTNCAHTEDVSIRCSTSIPYRLAGSNVTGEGRLEVQYNNTWGTVCDDGFTNVEASVACGSLGYSDGGEFINTLHGPGVGPIWLDDLKCNGNEQSIGDCEHSPWGTTNCLHDEDVSIRCSTGTSNLYRLSGSNITTEGRLEVFYNDTWGTVCDDSFTNVEASVACGSLGYSVGGEFINSLYGPGLGPIWLDDLKCSGTEQSIADCSHAPWGTTNCGHEEDVSIRCTTSAQIVYRLVGSNVTGEGRLEVKYNDTWGTVCDNSFGNVEARIACGSLGYSNGGEFISNLYGPGEGKIWLNDVKCNGTERNIADCSHLPWGSHSCVHDKDVSIRCH